MRAATRDSHQVDRGPLKRRRDVERLAHDERYQLLFTDSPWPNLVCDRQTLRIVDANAACLRLYGYSREELLALTLYDLDGDRERLRKSFESVAADFVELGEWTHRKWRQSAVSREG
jgi:PAS domain-containing protein